MPTQTPAPERPRADLRALYAAILLFAVLLGFVHGCGDDDLVFPGEIPFTPTSQFTATPEPTEDEDAEF